MAMARGPHAVRTLVCICLLVFVAEDAHAKPIDDLIAGPTAVVREVVDGDTVILDDRFPGPKQVRLVGLQAPKLPLGRKGFKEWPLAPDSKYALEELTLHKPVRLYFGGARMDRHGRHLAHLFLENGTWIQGRMLQRGMARVYTFSDNRSVAEDMYALETEARNANRGIWAHPFYAIRPATPSALERLYGTFQLVTGRVVDAARVKGKTYLNFGANWRDDFTITLNNKTHRLFEKTAIDPLALTGKLLRVRGWIKKRNGPEIIATHPEQLEILGDEQ